MIAFLIGSANLPVVLNEQNPVYPVASDQIKL